MSIHNIVKACTILLWIATGACLVLGFTHDPVWFAATFPYFILAIIPSGYFVIHTIMKRHMGG